MTSLSFFKGATPLLKLVLELTYLNNDPRFPLSIGFNSLSAYNLLISLMHSFLMLYILFYFAHCLCACRAAIDGFLFIKRG